MSFSFKFHLIFLILIGCLFSQTSSDSLPNPQIQNDYSPSHQKVLSNNFNLTKNLSFFSSVPSFSTRITPSKNNPLSSAFFTIGSISPSADNRIQTTLPSKLFFAWGADAPQSIEFSVRAGGCAPDKFILSRQGEPYIFGNLKYEIETYSKSILINSQTKNPINLDLSEIPKSNLYPRNKNSPPTIKFSFSGAAYANYAVLRYYYRLISVGKVSICVRYSERYSMENNILLSYSKNYFAESSPPFILILQPADFEQSTVSPQLKVVTLSNLQAQKISFNSNSKNLAYSNFGLYKTTTDELGFQNILKQNIIPNSSKEYSKTSDLSASFFSNSSNEFISPKEFMDENFSYEYYLHYLGTVPLGLADSQILFQDDFNQIHPLNFISQSRDLSALSLSKSQIILSKEIQNSSMRILQKESENQNSKYQNPSSQNLQYGSNSKSESSSLKINSSENLRSSYNYYPSSPKIANIAILFSSSILILIGIKFFLQK